MSQCLKEDSTDTEFKLLAVMISGAISSAGDDPMFFIKSQGQCTHPPGDFRASANKLYGDEFLFQWDLTTVPKLIVSSLLTIVLQAESTDVKYIVNLWKKIPDPI